MKKTWMFVSVFCSLLVFSTRAQAEHATGFMLQAGLGTGVAFGASSMGNPIGATVIPGVRIGGMLRPLWIAGEISYLSAAQLNDKYSGENIIVFGPVVAPYVWKSNDARAGLYLLGGFNIGAFVGTLAGSAEGHVTGGLLFGAGGTFFVHPNFAMGMEIGSRTQFTSFSPNTFATSAIYGALTATFVAGH